MAEVYRGQMEGANGFARQVAIKRVHGAWVKDRAFVEAFEREALLIAKLSHPNIVSVIDYQVDEQGLPFLVMEYVEGRDLAALVATGALPCSVAIFVVAEMLRGLAYAHQLPTSTGLRGVVHRDISPHNVLLSWQGDVKVSDFGIARALSTQGAFSAAVRGKPSYMSPEQIGSLALDGRSDLFAVGAVFWELLVGRRAFEGVTYSETLARVAYSPIPSLRDEVPYISDDVEAIVLKLLARDRDERYSTAQEALSDLLRCAATPKDGVGELVALMQCRLNAAEGSASPAQKPPDTAVDQWPGPLAVRTRVPTERRTDTLNIPAATGPQLGATLAAAGRITTGPNDVTIAAPLPSALSAASLPLAAAVVAPGPAAGAVEAMPLRGGWRKRRRTIALGTAALACGLVALLVLRSKPEQSTAGQVHSAAPAADQVQSTAPAAAASRPEDPALPVRRETTAPATDQGAARAPQVADRAPPASAPAHPPAERARAAAARPLGTERELQRPAPEAEPQPTAKRRIFEIDLGANGAQ